MGFRKITIKQSAADNIAEVAWYIESFGLTNTADNFIDAAYDFINSLSNTIQSYKNCKEPIRTALGYKCVTFKKKYVVVFIETEEEIIICIFISSKLIHW